jgi:hypothetical protein
MPGINTNDNAAAIKATIYSGQLRAQLEPDLIAMNYVDMITDFPDGESWEDLEIGNSVVHDYVEGEDVVFDGLEIGTRRFEINNYIQSGNYITQKFIQDSYLSAQIMAKIAPLQARAIYADLEQKILAMANKQKLGKNNALNGYNHRFVAGKGVEGDTTTDRFGALAPEDFLYAASALKAAGYTGPLVAIVPTYQEYLIGSNPLLSKSLKFNPSWEGIVRDGVSSGMKFAFNIMGFDVYTSEYLPTISEEKGLSDRDGNASTSTAKDASVAVMFCNQPDRRPFRMAWRQMPKFEGAWNMYRQREEYVTTARYGLGIGDIENLVVAVCKKDGKSSVTVG